MGLIDCVIYVIYIFFILMEMNKSSWLRSYFLHLNRWSWFILSQSYIYISLYTYTCSDLCWSNNQLHGRFTRILDWAKNSGGPTKKTCSLAISNFYPGNPQRLRFFHVPAICPLTLTLSAPENLIHDKKQATRRLFEIVPWLRKPFHARCNEISLWQYGQWNQRPSLFQDVLPN